MNPGTATSRPSREPSGTRPRRSCKARGRRRSRIACFSKAAIRRSTPKRRSSTLWRADRLIPVTEQSTGAGVPFDNFIYRGFNPAPSSNQKHATWRGTMSYVSGSHNMKWGYQAGYMSKKNRPTSGGRSATGSTTACRPAVAARGHECDQQQPPLQRCVHPGPVDAQPVHRPGRPAVRDGLELGAGRENGILADNEFGGPFLLPHRGRAGLPRHHATDGCGLRCLRQRQDGAQGERGAYLQGAWTGDAYTISNAGSTLVTTVNRSWPIKTGIAWRNATS